MADRDPEIVRRRLLRLLELRRPDMADDEREEMVEIVFDFIDPRGDLTYFWMGVYGVEPVA